MKDVLIDSPTHDLGDEMAKVKISIKTLNFRLHIQWSTKGLLPISSLNGTLARGKGKELGEGYYVHKASCWRNLFFDQLIPTRNWPAQ